jgi:hypothetical protein
MAGRSSASVVPCVTPRQAAEHGAPIFKIIEQTRHKSVDTLLKYVRKLDLSAIMRGRDSSDDDIDPDETP